MGRGGRSGADRPRRCIAFFCGGGWVCLYIYLLLFVLLLLLFIYIVFVFVVTFYIYIQYVCTRFIPMGLAQLNFLQFVGQQPHPVQKRYWGLFLSCFYSSHPCSPPLYPGPGVSCRWTATLRCRCVWFKRPFVPGGPWPRKLSSCCPVHAWRSPRILTVRLKISRQHVRGGEK